MRRDRRHVLALLAGTLASPADAHATAMTRATAYIFSFAALTGGEIRLADYAGIAMRRHPAISLETF